MLGFFTIGHGIMVIISDVLSLENVNVLSFGIFIQLAYGVGLVLGVRWWGLQGSDLWGGDFKQVRDWFEDLGEWGSVLGVGIKKGLNQLAKILRVDVLDFGQANIYDILIIGI